MNFINQYMASNPLDKTRIKDALEEAKREAAIYEQFSRTPAYKQLMAFCADRAAKAKEKIFETINLLGKGELIGADAEKRVYQFACELKAQEDLMASIAETVRLGKEVDKELHDIREFDQTSQETNV